MFNWYKYDIIRKLNARTHKQVVIGLGDSFTQGAGAVSEELWEKCNWDVDKIKTFETWDYEIAYYENSWVHQLCKNHLVNYIPINMGMIGRGNRGAVKELYLHPEIDFDSIQEKIVVFMLSGLERFDFVHKQFFEHIHFNTIWPASNLINKDGELWDAYGKHNYSDRTAIIELLMTIAELKTWCKLHNAKLIITSAFRPEYNREYFLENILNDDELPDSENYLKKNNPDYAERLIDIIKWDEFLYPNGYKSFADYLCHLEGRDDLITNTDIAYYNFAKNLEKLSPNGYITNCAHPSIKGHEAIAEVIFEHILKTDNNILKKNKKHGKKILANII